MRDKIAYFIGVLFILLLNEWISADIEATIIGVNILSTFMILDKLNEKRWE